MPAATGPITAIAKPIFAKAGVDLNIVPISAQTADMTPQIQQAISRGAKLFAITGTDDFVANAIKTLKQLGFNGTITLGAIPSKAMVTSVPGGVGGVLVNTSNTANPNDRDVQLYNAIISTYQKSVTPNTSSPINFATVMAFVRALDWGHERRRRRLDHGGAELDAQGARPAVGWWHHLPVRFEARVVRAEHLHRQRPQGHA